MLVTLEIDGTPAMVMAEDDLDSASATAGSQALADELATLGLAPRSAGTLRVRPADAREAAQWRRSFDEALAAGDVFEDEADDWATLLVTPGRAESCPRAVPGSRRPPGGPG